MTIQAIEDSKRLKKCFEKIGRKGISERAIMLLDDYCNDNPEHNYKEITKLIGRFHALYLAINNNDYWKEIADRGYRPEIRKLGQYTNHFEKEQNGG